MARVSKERREFEQLYAIEREQLIRKCRKSLWAFNCVIAPDFYKADRWHLVLLSWVLQYLYERKLTKERFRSIVNMPMIPQWFRDTIDWDSIKDRKVYKSLMINMPPRHGKSRELVNFCDWILGRSLKNRIITVSYNTDLASSMSRYVRDGIMKMKVNPMDIVYSDIFPNTRIAKGNAGFMKWALEGSFFNYLGTGLEGTITGIGGNCILAGTHVKTNKGNIPIEQICSQIDNYLILSLDTKCDKLVYKKILASQEVLTNEIIKFKTVGGREIACSKDHKFFDGRKFRKAGTFRKGDYFYTVTEQEEQKMCNLWGSKGWQGTIVPKMLHNVTKTANKDKVCSLRERVSKANGRVQQGVKEKYKQKNVLFKRMCKYGAEKNDTKTNLYCLWGKTAYGETVLFSSMSSNREEENQRKISRENLSNVQENVQTYKSLDKVLFKGMCQQSTFPKNDWEGQSRLQKWSKLCETVSRNEKSDFIKRREYMSSLWKNGENKHCLLERANNQANKPCMSSYRRGYSEQFSKEFDYCMQELPPENTSLVKPDKIISIEIESGEEYKLYDIQVEETSNFFAEQILTHNCTIIDDPVKNANEAYNDNVLQGIYDWYTGTFLSRQEEEGQGSINIINHTRWSTKDLCGRILNNPEMCDDWLVLSIPVWYKGEMLCPDILSYEKCKKLAGSMDTNIFNANYLQVPMDVEGRLFTKLKTYDTLPEGTEGCIAYCDTADEGTDYLACIIGYIKDGEGYITDIYFTQDNMEVTEPELAKKLYENKVNNAKIESNNGGKGFARNVEKIIWDKYHTKQVNISWFHQTENKMARILTGSTFIINHVYFPKNWDKKYPEFYAAVMGFSKEGKNKHDDGVEALVEWGKMITGDGSINSYIEMMKRMAGEKQ
jgi:predicted phage terminase large subunit-like protein